MGLYDIIVFRTNKQLAFQPDNFWFDINSTHLIKSDL